MKRLFRALVAMCAMSMASGVGAVLIDRGNGMIYDTVQGITWLSDANYARTSGYDADGRMTWDEAMAWADGLVYGGYDDWRLYHSNSNNNCSYSIVTSDGSTIYYGYECTHGELEHLFYISLGLSGGQSILGSTSPALSLFSNIQAYGGGTGVSFYWSDTEWTGPDAGTASWFFNTYGGYTSWGGKSEDFFAWAVRDGDVAVPTPSVPAPPTLALLLVPALLMVAGRRKRQSH